MFKILRKELKAFVIDKRALLLTFLLPIILISVFALAFGGDDGDGIHKIPLLVCDEDKSDFTKQIINDIDSVKMIYAIPCNFDTAIDLIKKGKRTSVIVFRKGFTDSVKARVSFPCEVHYDAERAQETSILQSLLIPAVYGSIEKQRKRAMSQLALLASGSSDNNVGTNNPPQTNPNNMKLKFVSVISAQTGNVGLVQAVAGTAVMMLLFSLTGMGGGLLDEKESGTLKRLLYSPVHPAEILLGKMTCSIIVASMQLTAMFVFASFVFHLHIIDKILPLAIIVLATAVACSGFGVFLATVARSRQQLQGMSTLIILSMSVIGGSMVPTFMMPQWMQNFSVVSINYWSIQGFYDVLWRQLPIGAIFLTKIGILLAIGIVLTLLAFRFFRKNVLALD